jgi:DNA-binding GntR family transcriptional regulator
MNTDPLGQVRALSPGAGPAAVIARAYLRQLIMQGVLAPGTTLPQVQLAERLGISRTPLREAMRMLQEEGLVEAEPQKRARVPRFDPAHLEAVYTQRVLLEGMGALVTAGRMAAADVADLGRALAAMEAHSISREPAHWQAVHRGFHLQLICHAGGPYVATAAANMDFADRYRLLYQRTGRRAWQQAVDEHVTIVAAFRARDAGLAAAELASHLARTALALIAEIAPSYDPVRVRAALAIFHGEARAVPGRTTPDRVTGAQHVLDRSAADAPSPHRRSRG